MLMTGMKVVCVDDKFPIGIEKYYAALPKEGKQYTVRSVSVGISVGGEEGEICVLLHELFNPKSSKGPERGFKEERFRPLDELPPDQIVEYLPQLLAVPWKEAQAL